MHAERPVRAQRSPVARDYERAQVIGPMKATVRPYGFPDLTTLACD